MAKFQQNLLAGYGIKPIFLLKKQTGVLGKTFVISACCISVTLNFSEMTHVSSHNLSFKHLVFFLLIYITCCLETSQCLKMEKTVINSIQFGTIGGRFFRFL